LVIGTDDKLYSACSDKNDILIGRSATDDDSFLLEEVDIDGNKPVKFFTYNRIVDSFGVITDQYDNNAYVWGLNQDG